MFNKRILSKIFVRLGCDAIFRWLNKGHTLILAYHSIDKNTFGKNEAIPLYTHIPESVFETQLQILKKYYNVISLNDAINCIKEKKPFPNRAAMITFDDGYMNNYTNAFPLLKKYNLPATVFLTIDFIGSDRLLWFDEVFLVVRQLINEGSKIDNIAGISFENHRQNSITVIYQSLANKMKRMSQDERLELIDNLKKLLKNKFKPDVEPFALLNWEQISEMKSSGLIDFGVHTATHRIVSELSSEELEEEINIPQKKLSIELGCKILAFAYPNGIPDIDFNSSHEEYLEKSGYLCAFTTGEWLNSNNKKVFRLGRIAVGNDISSDINFFRLNTAGFITFLKK